MPFEKDISNSLSNMKNKKHMKSQKAEGNFSTFKVQIIKKKNVNVDSIKKVQDQE